MDQLPVFLNLKGQHVLLVGSGAASEAKRRLIEAAGGLVVDTPDDARIAFVALDDEDAARKAATELRAIGLLVNVVDRPALCDFTVPAIVDRSPVIVAIGTGGASASLAKALRERFEALLPSGLGSLANSLRAARPKLAAKLPMPADRRAHLDAMLAPGGRLDPMSGAADTDVIVAAEPDAVFEDRNQQFDVVVSSDDPDDLSLRQLRLLSHADVIICDEDVPPTILDRARRDALRVREDQDSGAHDGVVVRVIWKGL